MSIIWDTEGVGAARRKMFGRPEYREGETFFALTGRRVPVPATPPVEPPCDTEPQGDPGDETATA